MKNPNALPFPLSEPEFAADLKNLLEGLRLVSSDHVKDRLTYGDDTVQEARIYVFEPETTIAKATVADGNLYHNRRVETQGKKKELVSELYLEQVLNDFMIQKETVVFMNKMAVQLTSLLGVVDKLVSTYGVKHLLLCRRHPGFNLYFERANVVLQFFQPKPSSYIG